ncbi:MAG: glutamate-ammonia-ligase adenylyltransferase [Glaciecola sp.]|jgi:glutamate-ammonia-ligase adenylyltransferase
MQKLTNALLDKANANFDAFKSKVASELDKQRKGQGPGQLSLSESSSGFSTIQEPSNPQKATEVVLIHKHQADIIYAFGLSDFIARVALLYPIQFIALLPELSSSSKHKVDYEKALNSQLDDANDEANLHKILRQFRNLNMLCIAWRDLMYKTDIKQSLLAVSNLADSLINAANNWLFEKACERYGSPAPLINSDPINSLIDSGPISSDPISYYEPITCRQELLIIGMGKLGGHELNFSSDIDLIFVYPEQGETDHPRKPIEHQVFFTRLAQKLIAALHQITMDGQVYRVDMRLRPLGDSGPLVVSMPAFESYYLEQGREWERFAMQKARVINADSPPVRELQNIITPFVYRKYLDFTTIESLRSMKQLIASEVARRNLVNNIKLGKGGIREVEFFIQSLQMIHAGKVTECQTKSILASFTALVEHEFLAPKDADELQESYLFLRIVEHYLQAFDDQQTQQLPDNTDDQDRLTLLLMPLTGKSCYADNVAYIQEHMHRINRHFMSLIEAPHDDISSHDPINQAYQDLWSLSLDEEEMQSVFLTVLNPTSPSKISIETPSNALNENKDSNLSQALSAQLIEFKRKCKKHDIGQRGHVTLKKLIPLMIQEVITHQNSNDASELFKLIFDILLTIVGRTTYLDLLLENPAVRKRLVGLSARSKWVAKQIKGFPLLLDELLHPAYLQSDSADITAWRDEYENELRLQLLRVEPDDVEAQMDALRYFKLTQQLRIAAADISGTLPVSNVSDKLTVLAEVLLQQVIDSAWLQITNRYGAPSGYSAQNKGLGVIAYGKMGGVELGYGSDLDIVFVHDVNLTVMTDGTKQISCSEFFVKLVQRISHIFSTKTYLNELYEIDLRLRPSGNSGLLVTHIDSFEEYQNNEAWTWEHQALVRARYVYGHHELGERFMAIRRNILAKKRQSAELKVEVANMRSKMRAHLDKSIEHNPDLKQTSGGITDLEFLTQYWVLLHTNEFSELAKWTDNLRILDSLENAKIIDESQNKDLKAAYLFIRNQLHNLSISAINSDAQIPELQAHMAKIKSSYSDVLE